jgi:predicted transcriptional regulator with HTH domain
MTLQYKGIEEDFRERLEDVDAKERILRAPETSIFTLRPGDVVQFNYFRGTRIGVYQGLVVSTKRSGARGYRLTKAANTIFQVLTFEGLSDEVLGFVVNNLYKNRILSRYLSVKNRMNATDKRIDYSYLRNLGREDTELTEELKESTMARRALGRENRAGLVSALEQGQFKTFRVEKITNVYSIALLDPEVAQ